MVHAILLGFKNSIITCIICSIIIWDTNSSIAKKWTKLEIPSSSEQIQNLSTILMCRELQLKTTETMSSVSNFILDLSENFKQYFFHIFNKKNQNKKSFKWLLGVSFLSHLHSLTLVFLFCFWIVFLSSFLFPFFFCWAKSALQWK